MRIAAIIPAAGASTRYAKSAGFARSKLDEDLGGRSVLQRSVELFTKIDHVSTIIVAGPHDDAAFAEFRERHGDRLGMLGATICRGGKTHRYETVAAALSSVPTGITHIAVHDAARPCAPIEMIERVLAAAERHPAVVPAIEVADSIKRVREGQGEPVDPLDAMLLGDSSPSRKPCLEIEASVARAGLYATQTPQVFEAELLRRAYAQADLSSTDDAELVQRLGQIVRIVDGDPRNIKITTPVDLEMARLVLGAGPPKERPAHKRF